MSIRFLDWINPSPLKITPKEDCFLLPPLIKFFWILLVRPKVFFKGIR